MSAGMQKPPVAPKPKITQLQKPGPSPSSAPKRDGLYLASPGTPKKVKPAVAPKPPCLTTAVESKPLLSKTVHHNQTTVKDGQRPSEMSRSIALLNCRDGIQQQQNKKPDWDYIIHICLCSQKNCLCVGNGNTPDVVIDKIEKDLETLHNKGKMEESRIKLVPRSRSRENKGDHNKSQAANNTLPDVCVQAVLLSTNNHLFNTNQNVNSDIGTSSRPDIKCPLPQESTQSNEANGGGDTITSCCSIDRDTGKPNQNPAVHRKPLPRPVPWKPRKSALVGQEDPEEGRGQTEGMEGREGRETIVRKVKVSLERKSSPSLSVNAPTAHAHNIPVSTSESREGLSSSRTPCPPPAPAPSSRKKAFLSEPEKGAQTSATSSHPHLPQDVAEDNKGWVDDSVYEMECSVDKEVIHGVIICHPDSTGLPNQLELNSNCHSPLTVATSWSSEEDGVAQSKMSAVPKKPQRHSSPAALVLEKELSEEGKGESGKTSDSDDDGCVLAKGGQDGRALNVIAMRALPATPGERPGPGRSILQALVSPVSRKNSIGETLTLSKLPRSTLGKQRAKSFSSADFTRSEGQKLNSFRRLLELKLSVKMLPKLLDNGGQSLDCTAADAEAEQCVDGGGQDMCFQDHLDVSGARRFSCPQLGVIEVGVEQSVDEFHYPGAAQAPEVEYETVPYYEELPEYIILPVGLGLGSGGPVGAPPDQSDWHNHLYYDDDDNMYEEPEPYHPLEKHTEHQQQKHSERSSIDEDVGQMDDGQSNEDEDIMVHSLDEEDDSSSSSKGEPEQHGERGADSGAKESKIVHIAREIMSSENVFVNVLKLLHIDFRDAVAKASHQSGKPIIEERILNQILYYLPQLYELNHDLLSELEERVTQWDEHGRLADIFVKKGPYLKMYSTYIREFENNVALLDEQNRKNPAFAAVVRKFEASPCCASLALKHYLLKPVQRIPQYQLLLTDYLKNLSPDSADYKDTQAALGIVKEVANHANDIMKQGDNFQKLIQVQCRLNGHHELVLPGRVFLKEGVLMKLSRKVMQPRMFFLFNDTLLYTTPVQSGQFKLNNMLSLAGMKVSKPSQEAYQNELTIESVERSFILSGSSAVERDDWLKAISMAINDYTRKKISFISSKTLEETGSEDSSSAPPLGSKAPIWIPDPRATMCMICTCEFTLTWRRHHCRACGKVVCQSCSSNKHCLEYLKNQLARVCDKCFIILQQQRSEQALSTTLSPGGKSSFTFTRKTKRIPAALKEVSANTDNSSMSGYLQRSKGNKKQGKRLWFVIKNKVLYTYAASEDVAALESQPLLGFMLKDEKEGPGPVQKQKFKLYHKNTLHYVFKADDRQTTQRWIDAFKEAMVL